MCDRLLQEHFTMESAGLEVLRGCLKKQYPLYTMDGDVGHLWM